MRRFLCSDPPEYQCGLGTSEGDGFRGAVEGIMYLFRPLSRPTVSHRGCGGHPASREEGSGSRTQSTHTLSGTRGRRKLSESLTAAHSGSAGLSVIGSKAVAVYYEPKAFEDLEGAA